MPRPGWAEHDAEKVWWEEFVGLCRELLPKGEGRVVAVGVSGIGPCVVPCDANDEPLRQAILYGIDTRATAEIDELSSLLGRDEILRRCGSVLSTQALGPKLVWLRRHEPEVWAATARWHMASSFVVSRLDRRVGARSPFGEPVRSALRPRSVCLEPGLGRIGRPRLSAAGARVAGRRRRDRPRSWSRGDRHPPGDTGHRGNDRLLGGGGERRRAKPRGADAPVRVDRVPRPRGAERHQPPRALDHARRGSGVAHGRRGACDSRQPHGVATRDPRRAQLRGAPRGSRAGGTGCPGPARASVLRRRAHSDPRSARPWHDHGAHAPPQPRRHLPGRAGRDRPGDPAQPRDDGFARRPARRRGRRRHQGGALAADRLRRDRRDAGGAVG